FDRKRRISIHPAISFAVRALSGGEKRLRVFELGQQPMNRPGPQMTLRSSSSFASGKMVRISKIEIIGRKRRNKNSSAKNSPIGPTCVAQSHTVGRYLPQADGRKSRCRLVTTITKRSSHMPTFTTREIRNSVGTLVRTRLNQSACGTRTLQRMSAQ